MVVACCHCGELMHPVRETKRHLWTVNVSCPLSKNYACARSKEAHVCAQKIRDRMGVPDVDDETPLLRLLIEVK